MARPRKYLVRSDMNVLIIVWTITSGSVRMTLMMPPITNINKAEIFSQLQTIVLITATNHRRIFYIFFSSIKPYFASKKKIFSNAGAGHPSPYAMLNLDRCFTLIDIRSFCRKGRGGMYQILVVQIWVTLGEFLFSLQDRR